MLFVCSFAHLSSCCMFFMLILLDILEVLQGTRIIVSGPQKLFRARNIVKAFGQAAIVSRPSVNMVKACGPATVFRIRNIVSDPPRCFGPTALFRTCKLLNWEFLVCYRAPPKTHF